MKHRFLKKYRINRILFISGIPMLILLYIAASNFSSRRESKPLTENEKETMLTENIPDSLVTLAENNPEAISFVKKYPDFHEKKEKIDLSEDLEQFDGIPLFLQWDVRWGYRSYGGDFLAVTGCGPTCLSMVSCGLSRNGAWNPYKVAKMAEKNGYYVDGQGSSWELMTSGAEKLGLRAEEVTFDSEHIIQHLRQNQPIICAMRPGDFTTSGHFIVLTGISDNGEIIIHDPNSLTRSKKTWQLQILMQQIKNLWWYELQ